MAHNNQQAVIVVGQQVPLVTSSQVTNLGQTINSISYQDVGIILRVTPFISSDKTVEMIVAPEISSLSDQTVDVSAGVKAPIINKRSAETVVVTPNATTVVIGGLMQKQITSTVDKIPILGDIPLLGHVFRHTVKGENRSELLIFLTPYIIESTQSLKEITLNEANQSRAIRQNMSPEDIKDNLDTLRLMPQLDPECPPQVTTETTVIQSVSAPKKNGK
jgi:general secretion pathway protein D